MRDKVVESVVWKWHWPALNSELLVGGQASGIFEQYRQNQGAHERGGQLFVDPANPGGLLMSWASSPHPDDRSGRTWLELNAERCRAEIEQANTQGLRLVGYWHTHPQSIPQISATDIVSFVRFANRYRDALPQPVAVIVGTSPSDDGIKAWLFREGKFHEASRITS